MSGYIYDRLATASPEALVAQIEATRAHHKWPRSVVANLLRLSEATLARIRRGQPVSAESLAAVRTFLRKYPPPPKQASLFGVWS